MDKRDIKFIIIGLIALLFVVAAANLQKNAYPSQQTSSTQNTVNNSTDQQTAEQAPDEQVAETQSKYIDGTYEGQATGKNPGIKVNVTITGDMISDITIVSSNDNGDYFDEAAAVIPESIIKAQSTNVETVSGATLSSNGIIKAVEDALSKAVKQ
jgi:NosR/NirI family transcriptional regulator, nitrous oxide reductase regulator